jgi:DNA polymerase-3 subunit delta'
MSIHPAFSHLIGQPDALTFLSRALAAGRLPHGLLFAGPSGVGKRTTAVALATIFLADRPNDPESLDKTATLIAAGTHPDYHFVTRTLIREVEGKKANKAIDLGVDVVREHVVGPAGGKPVMGVGKVFVIAEAETMNNSAQNALLKTLEEPAGRTLILLLTDQPHALLSTIRSRTQMVRFGPLASEDALAILAKHNVESSVAKNAVALAGGSPGLALRWVQDDVAMRAIAWHRLLDTADAQRGPGEIATFLKAASDAYAEKQLARDPLGSEDGFRRDGLGVYFRLASDHLRSRLAADASPAELDRTCDQIDALRRAESYVDANVNVALVLQQVGVDLAGR